ncbi:MAG: YhjD/YihY/BrkB family envelope integrity protein [Haloferacaceae archaeon]
MGGVVELTRRVGAIIDEQRVTFLAAAVAYYAFVSLLPTLLLVLALSTTFFGEQVAAGILRFAGGFLTSSGRDVVAAALEGTTGRTGATVVGVGVLLWSSLKVFRGLDIAFVQVYGTEETVGFVKRLVEAAIVAGSVGAGAAFMIAIGAVAAALELSAPFEVATILVLPAVLFVVFLPLYYQFPSPDVTVREVIPGTAVAAVGWTVLQTGFQLYTGIAGGYQVYGLVGGVLLLVTWLYFGAVVLLVGAAINAVLGGHGPRSRSDGGWPDRQLQQAPGREGARMADDDRDDVDATDATADVGATGSGDADPAGAPDVAAMRAELDELRAELESFERDVDRRTVDRPQLEAELKRYVRSRLRRGHARGWGPYLVLLYGVVLTLGAFYYLSGGWAIAAMIVLFLSTLGLYVLFILVGIGLNALGAPGKVVDYVREKR